MTWSVQPEPGDEREREALLAALEQALAEEQDGEAAFESAWRRSGLEGLGRSAAALQSWREPGVVEP